ncbi:MAG: TAT-variant-translocated molybdopterin oxidoreductase [Planctomycetota bacterium]
MSKKSSKSTSPAPTYWRSIAELHGDEDFQTNHLHREFPVAASEFPEGVSRRRWMQLMGASLAMAGVAGCRYPEEIIAPFVIRPEGRVPGEFYQRATSVEIAGAVHNVLIRCFDGRPQHIEANREHPSGSGADAYMQASILSLYDPDRSRGDDGPLLFRGEGRKQESQWDDFLPVAQEAFQKAAKSNSGAGFGVLMSPTCSPTLARMVSELMQALPASTVARYDSVRGDAMRNATKRMLGVESQQLLDLSGAKVILSLGADFLATEHGAVPASAGFSKKRDPLKGEMSRLYVVEGGYTSTGTMADSRLPLRPGQMPALLAEVRRRVEALQSGESHDHPAEELPFNSSDLSAAEKLERFVDCLAHDIFDAGDQAVVVVGEGMGEGLIAAGIATNAWLGSLGELQKFTPCVDQDLETDSLVDLVSKVDAGELETLLILGDNPVFTSPGDVDVAGAIRKVGQTFYLGEYDDETAALCTWSLPLAHPLESWSDTVNLEGYYGVCQPQILPLMGGRTAAEVIALMMNAEPAEPLQLVRNTADKVAGDSLGEFEWRKLLHDGFLDGMRMPGVPYELVGEAPDLPSTPPVATESDEIDQDDFEVIIMPADGLYDGRFANNGWLQEMPQSITKITWGNGAVMGPATAKALGVKHGLFVTLRSGGKKIELPVFEVPGIAPGVVTVAMGYGRTRVGMVGGMTDLGVDAVGIDISPLRTSDAMRVIYGVEARPNFNEYEFATTQNHWAIDDIGKTETEKRSFTLVREGTTKLLEKVPSFAKEQPKAPHVPKVGKYGSLMSEPIEEIELDPEQDFVPQWGMSVDLSKCSGCNACVIACQSENNVPIVGPDQVRKSREMHWLRIDTYFQGNEDDAQVVHQPISCLHCETAPCEQVCPVAATVHTNEGINAMAYNRCIGTRYCANNCPVKVRRFNYFNYNEDVGVGYGVKAFPSAIEKANRKLQALVLNPDVTVRGRGVMEKCTYCVQRIEKAKIEARKDGGRPIKDGDIVSACQAACATDAIAFGNIADPESEVAKKRKDVRAYGILEQLNIKPRTEFLARVRNPHPRLMSQQQIEDLETIEAHHHGHGDHEDGHGGHGDDHGHGDEDHGSGDHHEDEHGHGNEKHAESAEH